jgi:hypothetical protein
LFVAGRCNDAPRTVESGSASISDRQSPHSAATRAPSK